jgi:hypothetical protein
LYAPAAAALVLFYAMPVYAHCMYAASKTDLCAAFALIAAAVAR